MLERTAYRIYPIIAECASKLITEEGKQQALKEPSIIG
jgi:hypothetical protein